MSVGKQTESGFIKAQGEPQMQTQGRQMVGVLQCLLIRRGRQENARGQARRSKQDKRPIGTEGQAESRAGQAG